MFDKRQKQLRLLLLQVNGSPELLPQRQNVVNLSLLYRYYLGKCSSELVPFSFSRGPLVFLIEFSFKKPKYYQDVYAKSFLFKNSLPQYLIL